MVNDKEMDFGKLHAAHSGILTRYIVDCRRTMDGDMELFLIMAIIGERTFNFRHSPNDMTIEEFVDGTVGKVEPLPINLQSISDYTGIPRETVRRKIDILIKRGWIERDARKYFTATDQANQAFLDLTNITQKYLHDFASAINKLP